MLAFVIDFAYLPNHWYPMPDPTIAAFQFDLVQTFLSHGFVAAKEWRSFPGERDLYSPRLDVVIGPYAFGQYQYSDQFTSLAKKQDKFLRHLHAASCHNLKMHNATHSAVGLSHALLRNPNARCFLAFEIENKVSRKHLMGGAINAAALGRLGIAVGWTPRVVLAFVRLRAYLLRLAEYSKNTFDPANLLVLSKEQLEDGLPLLRPAID